MSAETCHTPIKDFQYTDCGLGSQMSVHCSYGRAQSMKGVSV